MHVWRACACACAHDAIVHVCFHNLPVHTIVQNVKRQDILLTDFKLLSMPALLQSMSPILLPGMSEIQKLLAT